MTEMDAWTMTNLLFGIWAFSVLGLSTISLGIVLYSVIWEWLNND